MPIQYHAPVEPVIPTTTQTTGGAGAAVQIAIAANATGHNVLDWVTASMSVPAAAAVTLTITVGVGVVFLHHLPVATDAANAVWHFTFPHGIWSAWNQAITIDMSAPLGAVVGQLSAGYR